MVPGMSSCVHVSDVGDTRWNDISRRQQVCTYDYTHSRLF